MKMGYAITLIIGILILSISIVIFIQTLNFIRNGIRVNATVIDLEKNSDNDGGYNYLPVFKFQTITNREIVFKYHTRSSPPSFKIGEEVPVVYHADNPFEAKVLTYFGAFAWTIGLMAISMPLIVIGGGYFFTQQFLK